MKKQKIAIDRIKILFKQAEASSLEKADRYVQIARKISMRNKVPVPRSLKRKFCKHCNKFFRVGKTCRVRIHKSRVIYFCKACKKFSRYQLK